MKTRILLFLLCVFVAACQQTASTNTARGPQVKRELMLVPIDQVHLYGARSGEGETSAAPPTSAAATNVASVQTEPSVSAIQYNRYADPARPGELMHEAHIVYRRETLPRWRLQPAAKDQQILVGPQLTDGRGEVKALASQELENYVREQRANQQKQQQLMATVAEAVRQLAQQQQQLAGEVVKLKAASPNEGDGVRALPAAGSSPEPEPTADGLGPALPTTKSESIRTPHP
jgi:hypothetical protein